MRDRTVSRPRLEVLFENKVNWENLVAYRVKNKWVSY